MADEEEGLYERLMNLPLGTLPGPVGLAARLFGPEKIGQVVEPIAALGSALISAPVAGVAALAEMKRAESRSPQARQFGTPSAELAANRLRGVLEETTFQPRTEAGQRALGKTVGALQYVPEQVGALVSPLGPGAQTVAELTADPLELLPGGAAFKALGGLPLAQMVGGRKARGAPIDKMVEAQGALLEGQSPTGVFRETGIWEGPEGLPRFWISDKDAELVRLPGKLSTRELGQVLKHEELYRHYPHLRKTKIVSVEGKGAAYDTDTGIIEVGRDQSKRQQLLGILHEVQHTIQGTEGFARGSSSLEMLFARSAVDEQIDRIKAQKTISPKQKEDLVRLKELKKSLRSHEEAYLRTPGEAEAFSVEALYPNDPGDLPTKFAPIGMDTNLTRVEGEPIYELGGKTKFKYAQEASLAERVTGQKPVFFSPLERFLEETSQKSATAEQWLATLKNKMKPDELKFTGIEKFLTERTGQKISADGLRAAVDPYRISDNSDALRLRRPREINNDILKIRDEMLNATGQDRRLLERETADLQAELEAAQDVPAPEYSGLVLPGESENYRVIKIYADDVKTPGEYSTPHFESDPNLMVHSRIDQRKTLDNRPITFANEVQSDWHQAGSKYGYRQGRLTELPEGWQLQAKGRKDRNQSYELVSPDGDRIPVGEGGTMSMETAERQALNRLNRLIPPDAPFKKTWPELIFKRLLREAVDNGTNRLGWPSTANQIADIEGWDSPPQFSNGRWYLEVGDDDTPLDPIDVTSIVERYTKDLPKLAKKYGLEVKEDRIKSLDLKNDDLFMKHRDAIWEATDSFHQGRLSRDDFLTKVMDDAELDEHEALEVFNAARRRGRIGANEAFVNVYRLQQEKDSGVPAITQKINTVELTPEQAKRIQAGQPLFLRGDSPVSVRDSIRSGVLASGQGYAVGALKQRVREEREKDQHQSRGGK